MKVCFPLIVAFCVQVTVALARRAAAAALLAALEAFLINVSRNCISMTRYVTIDVTV